MIGIGLDGNRLSVKRNRAGPKGAEAKLAAAGTDASEKDRRKSPSSGTPGRVPPKVGKG